MVDRTFRDRVEAGQQLAKKLKHYANQKNTLIFALPRGGVPVAFEVAKALKIPLDVFLVRKLGVPGQEELAMGAIAMGDVEILNEDVVANLQISRAIIDRVKAEQQAILQHRNALYRENRPFPTIKNKTIILIDDGVATGATMRAAITAMKQMGCRHLVVAIPLAPFSTYHQLTKEADEVVCLTTPEPFFAIGNWYENFPQTSDEEVRTLLRQSTAFPEE